MMFWTWSRSAQAWHLDGVVTDHFNAVAGQPVGHQFDGGVEKLIHLEDALLCLSLPRDRKEGTHDAGTTFRRPLDRRGAFEHV